MDPFGSHIQSIAASLLAAESTAHVRPRPAFKTRTDRRGEAGGGMGGHSTITSAPRCCDAVGNPEKTEADTCFK